MKKLFPAICFSLMFPFFSVLAATTELSSVDELRARGVEVVEIENHPWFVGTQYHPEYKSTVQRPHPLFVAFVAAALAGKDDKKK